MSVGQPASPATLRSILVDSSRKRSDRVHTGPDDVSSSSRPPITPTSRMRNTYTSRAGAHGALCCCVVMVSLMLLVVVLLFPRSGPVRHHAPCWTQPCRDFVAALAASINASRDPCQDFYSYVCDRWRPSFGGRSMLEDSAIGFRRDMGERAARTSPPRQSQHSYEKAVMLYKSCLAESAQGIDEFKRFLRKRYLPWPKVDKRVTVLDVALDLSFHWHFPIFFYVYRISSVPEPSTPSVYKRPSVRLVFTGGFLGLGPRLLLQERELRKNNTEHICRLRDALKERGDKESEAVSCKHLDELQRSVLSGSMTGGDEPFGDNDASWTRYNSLDSFAEELTPSVSAQRWLELLRKYMPHGESFGAAGTPIEVYNKLYMRKLERFFGSDQPQADMLRVAGLCVVQGLGRFASNRLATLIYGDDDERARRHPDLCYAFVDQVLPHQLSARYVALLHDTERVAKATEVFSAVKSFVVKSLRNAAWFNAVVPPKAVETIKQSSLTYEAVLSGEASGEELPSNAAAMSLPDLGDDFLENLSLIPHSYWYSNHWDLWTETRPSGSAADGTIRAAPSSTTEAQRRWEDVWRQHEVQPLATASSQDVVLPNLYMLESVFPTGAYESVNYGVLGSLLARRLLAVLLMAPAAHSAPSHLSWPGNLDANDSAPCVWKAFSRYGRPSDGTAYRDHPSDVVAMLVAVASLKPLFDALSASPGYPDWSHGFEEYSADQLFFLALCFPSCRLRQNETVPVRGGPSQAAWCNVPLGLFHVFGEAFRCSAGQTMNPSSKCAVW
ncbi:kell blood group glycoprotein-like [Dermacentor variabilis]|uniref:kell blood group glycoprotein-like n=1 Tax=Dermacentor variabilis TaxID=34621 RepID=UPI003F5B815E